MRFQSAERRGQVRRGHNPFPEKIRRAADIRSHFQGGLERPRVDAAKVQVQDIAHRADGERKVEAEQLGLRGNAAGQAQLRQAARPQGAVVVLRQKALVAGGLQPLDDGPGLRRGFVVAHPVQGVAPRPVEFAYFRLVAAEPGLLKRLQPPPGHQAQQFAFPLRGETRRPACG